MKGVRVCCDEKESERFIVQELHSIFKKQVKIKRKNAKRKGVKKNE